MRRAYLGLCGLLATLVCSSAFPQQQALITIDPNNFAAGQNISSATPGAQLLAMTYLPNPDPNLQGTFIVQNLPAVFAQRVAAGCIFFAGPCAASGDRVLGYSPTTSTQAVFWGDSDNATNCVLILPFPPHVCDNPGGLALPVLRVDFAVPTDKASALIAFGLDDPSEIDGFAAFDGSGNFLARCSGGVPIGTAAPPGCMTVFSRAGSDPDSGGWAFFTISRPSRDISFVLIGGQGNDRPISQVQFDSPVSLQLAGLHAKVQGVGPGHSLANKLMLVQAYYAVPDIQATCAQLGAFADEVEAQRGKKIPDLTALQLLSTATAIQAAIGCNDRVRPRR